MQNDKKIMTPYSVLQPNGTEIHGCVGWENDPGYTKIAALVEPLLDGADLEHVNVFHEGRYTDMFVDECSRLKGLPRNEKATAIYRNNWLTHVDPKADPESLPFIAGPAILFFRKVWF